MALNLRSFLLKTIPYMLSIAGGWVLFKLTENDVSNENLSDLVNNMAASLLAIPLVFLLYDYSNYLVSNQLNKTMASHTTDKLNIILLNFILIMRQILGARSKLTFASLNNMADLSVSKIALKLKITPAQIKELRIYENQLDVLIDSSVKSNILTNDQIQMLTGLMREVALLINEHNFRHNRHIAAKYIKNIIGKIIDWLDSDAFASMHFQQLLGSAEMGEKNDKNIVK